MYLLKFHLLFIISLCFNANISAQISDEVFQIDSIQELLLNHRIQDSSNVASAYYEIGRKYRTLQEIDSSYLHFHKAEELFKRLGDNFELAQTIYEIAKIQTNQKDYTGSEVTSVKVLDLLDNENQTDKVIRLKSYVYNNLGIVFNELVLYDESIKYHKVSIDLKKQLDGDNQFITNSSLSNLAFVYKNSKQYSLALDLYSQILSNKLIRNEYPGFYALNLDNYANTLYLSNQRDELPELYLKALRICDSIGNTSSNYKTIIINQHLAEYYNDIGNKDSAKYYSYKAKDLSQEYFNDDLLKSLRLLSKIEEGDLAVKHLEDYIKLSDSLQKNERATRNKFYKIRYDSDQLLKRNKQISKERSWLLIISVVLIMASFFNICYYHAKK